MKVQTPTNRPNTSSLGAAWIAALLINHISATSVWSPHFRWYGQEHRLEGVTLSPNLQAQNKNYLSAPNCGANRLTAPNRLRAETYRAVTSAPKRPRRTELFPLVYNNFRSSKFVRLRYKLGGDGEKVNLVERKENGGFLEEERIC